MAEPLVLLPGAMCDARVFSDQILAFNAERPVHLAALCTGGSVTAMAREVLIGAPRHFALMGHGLGAVIAMDMMRQAPERITRVALGGCSALAESPPEAAAREPGIVAAQSGQLEKALGLLVPEAALAPGPRRAPVQAELLEMGRALGPEVYVRQARAMQRRPDQQKTLRKFRAPALLLCGAHDTLTPPKRHEFMAGLIPNATLDIIEDAGHMPLIEAPEAVTEVLRRWLKTPLRLG